MEFAHIMNLSQFTHAVELGLIYGLLATGVYMSFRILDFPDMTVDGSFPMGAGIAAVLIIGGHDPWFATLCAMAGGAAAGTVTALLNVYGRILHLLASILTMTALYSINLRIMGKPNLPMIDQTTIYKTTTDFLANLGLSLSHKSISMMLTVTILTVVLGGLFWFMNTQMGLSMRATGKNKVMATAEGIRINGMVILGIAMSNSIYALCGSIFAQSQGIADVNMGTGTIVAGLAAIIIGEALVRTRSVVWAMLACVLGAVTYRIVIALALNSDALGLESSDLNLVSSVLIASAVLITQGRHSLKQALQSTKNKKGSLPA